MEGAALKRSESSIISSVQTGSWVYVDMTTTSGEKLGCKYWGGRVQADQEKGLHFWHGLAS